MAPCDLPSRRDQSSVQARSQIIHEREAEPGYKHAARGDRRRRHHDNRHIETQGGFQGRETARQIRQIREISESPGRSAHAQNFQDGEQQDQPNALRERGERLNQADPQQATTTEGDRVAREVPKSPHRREGSVGWHLRHG